VAFDIAGLEIFLPLLSGGTVVMAPEPMTRDGRALAAALETFEVHTMQATPAMWRMLINSGWEGRRGLVALSGGEALTPSLADALSARTGALWNVYGPTETTIWSSAARLTRPHGQVTVGRPLANTRFYILDQHRQPVPPGAVGELAIAGDGIARGYLNRPALTDAAFLTNVAIDGQREPRLFLTGDRARYLGDGSVVLLGRRDDQVKLNGYRIELGEIEETLTRHPGIRDAAVTLREGGVGEGVLVAYCVQAATGPHSEGVLRDYLRGVLPAYMVPTRYVFLERLPLTTSGKVDRGALPPPPVGPVECGTSPRTPLEEVLASTYAAVLGLERVSVDDNFFELGGGSLQIIEVMARCRDHGVTLSPELFFEYQTISTMARHLGQAGRVEPVAGATA
jgi:acyl-coenzyme A synthetase/AMP-(fatty) acid ligase